jgi:hypothetical protein
VINHHIARLDFILNDLFSGGRNTGKILKFTSHSFSSSVAMTSHKQKVAPKFYKRKYKFVHTELVQVSMILNGSAHGFLDLKINTTNNP